MLMRIQIAVYDKLEAEAVGDSEFIDRFWNSWCRTRNDMGLVMGGACIHLASLPRTWNVNVGETIPR